jgi:hypothetical protein
MPVLVLTDKETKQAQSEGWAVRNGVILRVFDNKGMSRFDGESSLRRFLYRKGQTSELHRKVVLSYPWGDYDNLLAQEDGWRIKISPPASISKIHLSKFLSDEDAIEWVRQKADEQSPLHMKAVKRVAILRLTS